jgi:predicted Zn-dependent peptidase
MAAYFDDRYSPDNTVVALAGRIAFDEMVQVISGQCGKWRATGAQRRYPAVPPPAGRVTIESPTVSRHYLLLLAPAPPMNDDRRYAAGILAQILGDADGSRLYWALIETGLAEEAVAQYDGRDGVGEYLIYCSCSPEDADTVQRIAQDEAGKLIDSLTEDDLQRVRSKVATAATLHGELPAGRMRRLGRIWTYLGEYRSLDEELARINAVTLDELRAVHAEYPTRPVTVASLTPDG